MFRPSAFFGSTKNSNGLNRLKPINKGAVALTKYADGYEQMNLFNEAEVNADIAEDEVEEIAIPSHKRKKRTGKKEEDLPSFEITETIEYKLTGKDRYCPDCGTKI